MTIEELQKQLKEKIKKLDKRVERFEQPSNYDFSKKIERLHGEALAYEKVLEMIEQN